MENKVESYTTEELETLRTGSSYQTRQNARWFATLEGCRKTLALSEDDAAALRARVAELEAQLANDAAWAEALSESAQRHMNGRESYWLAQRTKWIAEHDRYAESCKWHADRAEKAESERDALKLEVESLVRDMVAMTATANAEVAAGLAIAAERDALRTWVSAVSEALGAIEPVSDCRVELSADAAAALAESLRAERDALRAQVASVALLCVRAEDAEQLLAPDEVLAAMDEAKP